MPKHEFKHEAEIIRCTVCNIAFYCDSHYTEQEAWADECRGYPKPTREERIKNKVAQDYWENESYIPPKTREKE